MAHVTERGGWYWRCDACGVETVPQQAGDERWPVGWIRDYYPGGSHHHCPECTVCLQLVAGDEADWECAWDELG